MRIGRVDRVDHIGHQRIPRCDRFGSVVDRHHVCRKKLEQAVVVDVAGIQAHRAVAGSLKRRALPGGLSTDPALGFARRGASQPGIVRDGEVVAHDDVSPAVAVDVEQGNRHRLRFGLQASWHEFAVTVFVEGNPASALQEKFIAQIVQQAGIVGADHEIQIAVGIQVAPGHGIGWAGDAGQHLAAEAAGLAGLALVLPPGHAASPPGEDDIQPAVGIDVDEVNRARVAVVHPLGAKV